MKYKYHIVYQCLNNGTVALGTLQFDTKAKINSIDTIEQAKKDIMNQYGYENLLILNIIRLKR